MNCLPTILANIVDDHLMEVSHVIRGEEWLPFRSAARTVVPCIWLGGYDAGICSFASAPEARRQW